MTSKLPEGFSVDKGQKKLPEGFQINDAAPTPESLGYERSVSDVPTPENLAKNNEAPKRGGLSDSIIEPLQSVGGSFLGSVTSGLGGIYELIQTGDIDKAAEAVKGIQAEFDKRFSPETEAGKRGLEDVGRIVEATEENIIRPAIGGTAGILDVALNPVTNIKEGFQPAIQESENIQELGLSKAAGMEALEKTGSPLLATVFETFSEAIPEMAGGKFLSTIDAPKVDTKNLTSNQKRMIQEAVSGRLPNVQPPEFKQKMPVSPAKQKIIDDIKSGTIDKDLADKMLDKSGKVVKNKQAIEAIKQGVDSGVVSIINNSSPASKGRMIEMMNILEKGKKNPIYAQEVRPGSVAGDSLLKRLRFVEKQNADAGKQLNRVASTLKGEPVDISNAFGNFVKNAEEMGVSFDDNLVPDFTGSTIETIAPAKKLVKDIMLKIRRNKSPDANEAHTLKKFIDENVSYGKLAKGLSGKTESIAKGLRKEINDAIGADYPSYKEANTRFSDTIDAIDNLQKAAGTSVNLKGKNANEALGTSLRRLMSNAQSRVSMMDSVKQLNDVSKKYGADFDDDIMSQIVFADELDALFDTAGRTTFKGETKKGTKAAIDAATGDKGMFRTAVDLTTTAVEKAKGINEENRIKSIKKLLESKQ